MSKRDIALCPFCGEARQKSVMVTHIHKFCRSSRSSTSSNSIITLKSKRTVQSGCPAQKSTK